MRFSIFDFRFAIDKSKTCGEASRTIGIRKSKIEEVGWTKRI